MNSDLPPDARVLEWVQRLEKLREELKWFAADWSGSVPSLAAFLAGPNVHSPATRFAVGNGLKQTSEGLLALIDALYAVAPIVRQNRSR